MLNVLSNMEMEIDSLVNRINIYWDEYEGADVKHYILVRKKYSIPRNINDGFKIYDGLDTDCTDTNIKNGELYYYRLFICLDDDVYSKNVISDSKCIIKSIGFTNQTDYGLSVYNTFPEQVKFDDAEQKQPFPLKRMMQTIAFPFNKIDCYADAMLQQLDVDACDEIFLPYLAKWNSIEYNELLGADLNRLIIKTLNEIEPYINSEIGVRYLLQRIFKADVEIKVDRNVNLQIKMVVNSNNAWLLQHIDYIKGLIKGYCALSINYTITSSIKDDEIRRTLCKDRYFDIIKDNYNEEIIKFFSNIESCTNDLEYLTNVNFFTSIAENRFVDDLLDSFTYIDNESYSKHIKESYAYKMKQIMVENYDGLLDDIVTDIFSIVMSETLDIEVMENNSDLIKSIDLDILNNDIDESSITEFIKSSITELYSKIIEDTYSTILSYKDKDADRYDKSMQEEMSVSYSYSRIGFTNTDSLINTSIYTCDNYYK